MQARNRELTGSIRVVERSGHLLVTSDVVDQPQPHPRPEECPQWTLLRVPTQPLGRPEELEPHILDDILHGQPHIEGLRETLCNRGRSYDQLLILALPIDSIKLRHD